MAVLHFKLTSSCLYCGVKPSQKKTPISNLDTSQQSFQELQSWICLKNHSINEKNALQSWQTYFGSTWEKHCCAYSALGFGLPYNILLRPGVNIPRKQIVGSSRGKTTSSLMRSSPDITQIKLYIFSLVPTRYSAHYSSYAFGFAGM